MSDFTNASLFVSTFHPTGNPGEYSFTQADFNNQADPRSLGSTIVKPGFVLYIPASDINTAMPIPGVVHRYTLASCTSSVDGTLLDGIISWGELGAELDMPTNGSYCLLSQTTPNLNLGLPPSEEIYPNLSPGTSMGAYLTDIKNIIDLLNFLKESTFTGSFTSDSWVNNENGTYSLPVVHSLKSTTLMVCCWEKAGSLLQMTPLNPTTVDANTIKFTVVSGATFAGQVTVSLTTSSIIANLG